MQHKRSRLVAKKVDHQLTPSRRRPYTRPRSGCSHLVSRRGSGPSAPKPTTPRFYHLRKQQGRGRLVTRPGPFLGRPTGPRRSAGRPSRASLPEPLSALPACSAAAASAAAWAARPHWCFVEVSAAASGHASGPRLPPPALAPQRLLIQPWGAACARSAGQAWRRQICWLRQILSAICRL